MLRSGEIAGQSDQSTDNERLVGVAGWGCLTLHHAAAGKYSREIFKGVQYEG